MTHIHGHVFCESCLEAIDKHEEPCICATCGRVLCENCAEWDEHGNCKDCQAIDKTYNK